MSDGVSGPPHRPVLRIVFAAALVAAFCGFCALGVWQLQRLAWKQDLIANVDARLSAAPVTPPPRTAWPRLDPQDLAYTRVQLDGHYLPVESARTQAVTAHGAGWWLMSPLQTSSGDIIYVNRGFVPTTATAAPPPSGEVSLVGLLRPSEPGGGFLRSNAPQEDRWHSRDVSALARARGLPADAIAPFFVDAEHVTGASGWPRAGLTVVQFRNHHLQYALTWFGMALLTAFAAWRLFVLEWRLRHHPRHRSDASGPAADGRHRAP